MLQGQYNISSSVQSAFIIGNGTGIGGNRSNLVFTSASQFQVTGSLMVLGNINATSSGTISGSIGYFSNLHGSLTSIVEDQTGSYTLVATDAGKIVNCKLSSFTVTVPISVFSPGDKITITNSHTGGAQTITPQSGCTLYINGTPYTSTSFNLGARRMLIFHCTVGGANPKFFSQT
jgi:hypothetical protein